VKTTIIISTYPGDPWIDDLLKVLKRYKIPEENIVISDPKKKRTFSENNNLGAKQAKTPYVLFLNNDTIPHEDMFKNMEKILDSNQRVWVVGAKLYFLKNVVKHVIFQSEVRHIFGIRDRVQCAGIQFTKDFKPFEYGRTWKRSDVRVSKRQFVPAVTGACMLVRRDKFLEMGGFDEDFINGWEDTDFCLRVLEEGGQIMYEPSAECGHYFAGSKEEDRFGHEDQNYNLWIAKWHYTGRVFKVLTYQVDS